MRKKGASAKSQSISGAHGLWFGLAGRKAPSPDVTPDITIVGIPFDGAVSYRKGAAKGPDRIRRISKEIPPVLETGERFSGFSVLDAGNLRLLGASERAYDRIEPTLRDLASRSFLLTLGGDHSISIPVHRAISRLAREEIGIVFVDAHTDLSDVFLGSRFSHACPLRRALELPHYDPRKTVLVGTRCIETAGLEFIEKNGITVFPAYRIAEQGMERIAQEVIKLLADVPNVYLSIDIDALDPAYAPGTGIPEAAGLSTRELLTFLRGLSHLNFIAADLVEVAPPLDSADVTSFAAVKIVAEILGIVRRKKGRGERTKLV
jgi:agmatinase